MKKKRLLTGAAIVVAVLLVVPLLIPASLFVPHIQKSVSEALQDHVEIGDARLALIPLPHVTLRDLSVGKRPYLQVATLSVTPRLTRLLAERKVLQEVALRGVVIRQPLFDRLEALAARSNGETKVEVERVVLRRVDLQLQDLLLKAFEADVRLGPGNVPVSLLVQNADRSVRLSLTPRGRHYAVAMHARGWRLPVGPPLDIASLEVEGELTASQLSLPSVTGRVYGGDLSGQFAFSWGPEWQIAGHFDLKGVDLQPLAALYSRESAISGRLAAKGIIDMRASTAATLARSPNAGIDFEVTDGTLHRVDLAAAVKLLPGKEEGEPGQTRFDRFSGHLAIDPQGFHFTELKIASGVLNARGFVSVSPRQELSGRIDTALKGTGSLVGTPLAISGTLDAPKVRPTKGTLAGAAAGTLLLGPGFGTTIGMKAAELTERLFGRKAPKPKRSAPQSQASDLPAAASPPDEQPTVSPDPVSSPGRR